MGGGSDARGRIVAAALGLFCEKGYTAVGTQEICGRAGVLKGTLYHFFPGKADVALAALREYADGVDAAFAAAAGARCKPERRLARVFEATRAVAEGHQADRGLMYGCLHGNLALELAAADPRVRELLDQIAGRWAATLGRIVAALAEAGAIPPTDPAAGGRAILAYLHGVVLLAKTANDPKLITDLGRHALGLLGGKPAR